MENIFYSFHFPFLPFIQNLFSIVSFGTLIMFEKEGGLLIWDRGSNKHEKQDTMLESFASLQLCLEVHPNTGCN